MAFKAGYGTTLSGASTGALGRIVSLTWSGARRAVIDVTTTTSTNRYKEYIFGTVDPGEITARCVLDYTVTSDGQKHKAYLDAVKTNAAPEAFTVTYADSQTLLGYGYVKSCIPFDVGGIDNRVEFEVTIKLTATDDDDTPANTIPVLA